MASTGSSFDADNAGTIPEIIPIITDTLKPKAIFSRLKSIEKSKKLDTNWVSKKTKIKPKIPPIKHKKIDSNKNWYKIKLFFAPRDFCIPICLFLSKKELNK